MNARTELLATASATEVARYIRDGDVTSMEVVETCLERIDSQNERLRVFATVLADQALEAAGAADEYRESGKALPALHGIPIAVKDVFAIPGTATTVGSTRLTEFRPDGPRATSVKRLQDAGAIIIGKTNVGSGMTSSDVDKIRIPPSRNPWDPDRTPGGSSSGSAVAVATAMAYGAVGTDVGGSIRNPASFSGIVGLKPTAGLVSLRGNLYGVGAKFENIGPLTATVPDAELLLRAMTGPDPDGDPGAWPTIGPSEGAAARPAGEIRVAFAIGGGPVEAVPDVLDRITEAAETFRSIGFPVTPVELPHHEEGIYHLLTLADDWAGYESATDQPDTYLAYIKATLRRHQQSAQQYLDDLAAPVLQTYDSLFRNYDVLLLATAPITARRFDELRIPWRGGDIASFDLHAVETWMFNITGQPALSVPCGFDATGLPVGLQMVGRHLEEPLLLEVAARFEQARGPLPRPNLP